MFTNNRDLRFFVSHVRNVVNFFAIKY